MCRRSCRRPRSGPIAARSRTARDRRARRAAAPRRPRRRRGTGGGGRRPRPGATVDEVSAGVRSAGRGMTARIGPGSCGQRQEPARVADERDASARPARPRGPGARRSRRPTRSGAGPTEPSHARSAATRRSVAATSAGSSKLAGRGRTSVSSIRRQRLRVGRREQQVDAGADRRERRRATWAGPWASARMSSASLIVTPSKPRSRRSRSVITARDRVAGQVVAAGQGRQRHVARHREPGPGRERRTERHELARRPARNALPRRPPARDGCRSRCAPSPGSAWPWPPLRPPGGRGPSRRRATRRPRASPRTTGSRAPGWPGPWRGRGRARRRRSRPSPVPRSRSRARPAPSSPRSSTAPRAMFPANGVEPSPRPMSWPPSWSAATSSGEEPEGSAGAAWGAAAPARWKAEVSSRTWPGDRTL